MANIDYLMKKIRELNPHDEITVETELASPGIEKNPPRVITLKADHETARKALYSLVQDLRHNEGVRELDTEESHRFMQKDLPKF